MTCEKKKICVVCFKREAVLLIDDCYLCSKCADLGKTNFLLKCCGCGSATSIERTEHNIVRIAMIMLISQNNCISELHLNSMFSDIQREQPTVIPLNYCPHCVQEKAPFVGAKKTVPDQIPSVIF